jgi:inosine/xanthosine triphosphate pyrophosphatase family protein
MLNISFEELKTDDSLEKTALNKAKTCINLVKKENIIVSDVGIFIKSLNGFP